MTGPPPLFCRQQVGSGCFTGAADATPDIQLPACIGGRLISIRHEICSNRQARLGNLVPLGGDIVANLWKELGSTDPQLGGKLLDPCRRDWNL